MGPTFMPLLEPQTKPIFLEQRVGRSKIVPEFRDKSKDKNHPRTGHEGAQMEQRYGFTFSLVNC